MPSMPCEKEFVFAWKCLEGEKLTCNAFPFVFLLAVSFKLLSMFMMPALSSAGGWRILLTIIRADLDVKFLAHRCFKRFHHTRHS